MILNTNEVKIAFSMAIFLFMKSLFFVCIPFTQGQVGVTCHSLVLLHTVREKSGQKHLAFHDQSTYKWWSMIKTTSWLSWPCSSGFTSTRYKLNFYVKCLCINTQQNIYGYLYLHHQCCQYSCLRWKGAKSYTYVLLIPNILMIKQKEISEYL